MVVWLLIVTFSGSYNYNQPLTVDNIATKESCVFLLNNMRQLEGFTAGKCVQISKVRP